MSRGLIWIEANLAPHAAAWQAAVALDGLEADVFNEMVLKPENQGRWDWVLWIAKEDQLPALSRVRDVLRPRSLACLVRTETGACRLDTCSYGVALTSGFQLFGYEEGPLFPLPTSGPQVTTLPGQPPLLWPDLAAHGLGHLKAIVPDSSVLTEVLSNPAGARLWHSGLVFRLPSPDAPVAHLDRWPDVRTLTWVSRADLGPLHGVPATAEATRDLHRLTPIPVARAVLGVASSPSRLS
jgi:hypothetical protein